MNCDVPECSNGFERDLPASITDSFEILRAKEALDFKIVIDSAS